MKIHIRPRGLTLTETQSVQLERDLYLVLARFGERIGQVVVQLSPGHEGLASCQIELRLKPQILKVEASDTDVVLAMEHAALRLARSVRRAIEAEGLIYR